MDAIEQILTRLPVKHVLRCKLLSKACYDLIKTPSFINKHLLHRQSHNKIFVGPKGDFVNKVFPSSWIVSTLSHEEEDAGSEIFTPYHGPDDFFTIFAGSCNGLLLLSYANKDNLTVCNPATRDYTSVPNPEQEKNILKLNRRILYYTVALGFTYDAKSGDYKVIKVSATYYSGGHILIQVWNMSTNTWKQINPNPPIPSPISDEEYVFFPYFGLLVDGILYWLAIGKLDSGRDPAILSFDSTNDAFGQIVLPEEVITRNDKYDDRVNLIDFMGSLALSNMLPLGDSSSSERLFDIWVMGSDSVWTKRFSIGPFPLHSRIAPVCINGNFVLYRGLKCHPESMENICEIILYDPHYNRVVKKDTVYGLQDDSRAWSATHCPVSVVTESLVSVRQTTCKQ